MVIADKNYADSGDLSEIHRTILKKRQRVIGGFDDQPNSPGEMEGVLTSPVGRECVKAPRKDWGDRENISSI
jgi:hypothetical protein